MMSIKKWIPLIAIPATLLLVIWTLSVFNYTNPEPVTAGSANEENEASISENNPTGKGIGDGDVSISNSISNDIEGENADVENSVDNNVLGDGESEITNDVLNNISVSVDVSVTNNVENNIDRSTESSGDGAEEDGSEKDKNGEGTNGDGNGTNNNEETNGDADGNGQNGETNGESVPDLVWGVDSASITTDEMLGCVRENFGDPQIWGRYLGTNEGASYGLTQEEVELLHSEDIQILVIYNHFNDGTGYEHGQNHAQEAIDMAREFGIPEGVALFANVEPIYPIDADFILGWYDVISESEYNSGVYGVFHPEEEVYIAYEAATEQNSDILENNFIWTASPNYGVTTEDHAPEYNPNAPEGSVMAGWQYGLDAETCNIDTNHFNGEVLEVLW